MSSTRALQAAQKRRAEVPGGKPSPQPSINSSQMFNQQGQGQGQMQGRGQGQQSRMTQAQQQSRQSQAQGQGQGQPQGQGQEGPSKMTLPQAITLITLRLGSLETKLMNMEHNPQHKSMFSEAGGEEAGQTVNLEPILSRLEFLEQRKDTPASTFASQTQTQTHEIATLKTQMEALKQFVVKNKATTATTGPSISPSAINELNAVTNELKKDILELKESIKSLQQMSIENTNKLMEMELSLNSSLNCGSDEFNNDRYSSYIGMNDNVDEMMNAMFRTIGSTMGTMNDDNRNILDEEDIEGIKVEELGDDDNLNGIIQTID